MRRLEDAREHLDGALTDRETLAGNLRDLRRVNAVFGGASLSFRAIRAILAARGPREGVADFRVLDVGTGAADIPLRLVRARGPWASIHVTAVDSRAEVIEAAQRLDRSLGHRRDITLSVADGRRLPFGDDEFDVAHASLVLHHLQPCEAVAFARELDRVARLGVVINDLQRGLVHYVGAWLLLHGMTRNAFTLHDGPMSVRRAYTRDEARGLVEAAGLEVVEEIGGLAGHRWAIAAAAP
jgi:ubiquinone/menaquinone biosynthesis C-methylase UbiE